MAKPSWPIVWIAGVTASSSAWMSAAIAFKRVWISAATESSGAWIIAANALSIAWIGAAIGSITNSTMSAIITVHSVIVSTKFRLDNPPPANGDGAGLFHL